jgi:hypothetical protein
LYSAANDIQGVLPILETVESSMASGAFKSSASSPLALPSESPHGNALPPIIDHEAARGIAISQQSADVAITAVFESELPPIPELLPLKDLLCLSVEALVAKIAATSPEFAAYSAVFVRAGFSGAVLSSYASASDIDLGQLLIDVGIEDASHRQRLISELRLLHSRYAALEVPPLQLLPLPFL